MSTRVISDRELLHNLRFEVDELRRGLAAAIERLEALEGGVDPDPARRSRRVGAPDDFDDERLVRLGSYLALAARPTGAAS